MNVYTELSPIDGTKHAQNMQLLNVASLAVTSADFRRFLPTIFNGFEIWHSIASDAINAKTWWAEDPATGELLVMILGMQNFDKVPALITGWADPLSGAGGNTYPLSQAASTIRTQMGIFGQLPVAKTTILGHSYGGAVAMYLGQQLIDNSQVPSPMCYTYGAPKAACSRNFSRTLQTNTRRVFIDSDPVQALPLNWEELDGVWAITGAPTARAWSRWYHGVTGLKVLATGEVVATPLRGAAPGPELVVTLAGWLSGANCFGNDNHSLNAYLQRCLQIPAALRRETSPTTQSMPQQNARPTSNQLAVAQGLALAGVQQNNENSPQDAANTIFHGTPLVQGERFYGKVVGRRQAVLYGQSVVTYTKTRRTRRAIVRYLNRLIVD